MQAKIIIFFIFGFFGQRRVQRYYCSEMVENTNAQLLNENWCGNVIPIKFQLAQNGGYSYGYLSVSCFSIRVQYLVLV
jgi:hypothetical protein